MRSLLFVALLAAALRAPARAQVNWPLTATTSTDTVPFVYSAKVLNAVPDAQCCAWRRWCPGGAVRFRCTAAEMTACANNSTNSTGPRCTACGVCAAAALAHSGVALRATAPLSTASLACIDTLRPLKTARQSVLNKPVDPVPGLPPESGDFTVTQLGSAVPDAGLAPGAPRFVVCKSTAFKCVSMRPPGAVGECQPVRGVRTPRAGSVFSRLWDTRGRSSRESANAGGTLAEAHAALVVNPLLWTYDGGKVATLQDREEVEGNSDGGGACPAPCMPPSSIAVIDCLHERVRMLTILLPSTGLFGDLNGTRYPAVRDPNLWNVNPFLPPPPPKPPPPPPVPP